MLVKLQSNRNCQSLLESMQNSTASLEDSLIVSDEVKPYDSVIILLGIYSDEMKSFVYSNTYTQMFIAALLIIAKTWRQLTCSLIGKLLNKLVYPENGISFHAKKN
jgi:hypothetical protein